MKSIQLGQIWRNNENGRDYLVTKVYNEVFSQYAMLRPTEDASSNATALRVKVAKNAEGVSVPGFTFTQEGSF